MGIAALGFFVTLFNAINERRYDIALMRSLGATRQKIFAFVLAEGLMLGGMGTLLGVALGHGFAFGVQRWIESTRHMALSSAVFQPEEFAIIAIALAISAVAAIIPAHMAYKINVASVLSKGQ